MSNLCISKRFAAILLLAATSSGLAACESAHEQDQRLNESELVGSWYGIYAQGRDTVLFEAELQPDGLARLLYRVCFATEELERREEVSNWSLDMNVLSFSFQESATGFGDENTFVHSYRITESIDDYVRYISSNGRKFWMERKWSEENYSCATTKSEVNKHREAAFAAGNATSELFLGEDKPATGKIAIEKSKHIESGEVKP